MAQYFTQQRDLGSVTPVFIDDTDRVMKEADEIITRQQAVNSYEERERANLIKNLRTVREFEKGLNTRNHQMLMQNMQQLADIQFQNDRVRKQQRINAAQAQSAQEQRTFKAIDGIIKHGGALYKAGQNMATEAVQRAAQDKLKADRDQAELDQDFNRIKAITLPQSNEGEAFGVQSQLSAAELAHTARGAQATEARMNGLDVAGWAGIFLSSEQMQLIANKVYVGELTERITRGNGIIEYIKSNPNKTVTYPDPDTKQPITRTFDDIVNGRFFKSGTEMNYAFTEIAQGMIGERIGSTNVNLYHEDFAKIRGSIDDQSGAFSKQVFSNNLEENQKNMYRSMLQENQLPSDITKNVLQSVDSAAINPVLTRSQAIQNVTTEIIPYIPQGQLDEVLDLLAEAKNKDGQNFFGRRTMIEFREAAAASKKKFNDGYLTSLKTNAKKKAFEYFTVAKKSGGDGFVTIEENSQMFKQLDARRDRREISDEAHYYIQQELYKLVKDDADPKLAKERWSYELATFTLTNEHNDLALASGYINSKEHSSAAVKIKEFNAIKIEGEQYSQSTVKSAFKTQVFNAVGKGKLDGQPADGSARTATAIAYDIYTSKLESYINQVDTEGNKVYSVQQAHDQAYNDVMAAIDKGEGVFHVNDTDPDRAPYFSRLTPGRHTGSPQFPAKPTTPASQFGASLSGVEGLEKLKTTSFPDLMSDYVNIRERAKLGLSYKPSEYLQAVADESGHSVTDIINTMLEANGETVRIKRESPLEILKSRAHSEPEFQKLLDNITIPKLLSLQANMKDVMPHTTGTGSQAFHNMTSIGLKLKDANASKVADAWMKHTKGGRNLLGGSPLEQYQQISKMYDIPYVPAQVTLIAGLSPTMEAIQSQFQPVDRGGLFNLVMGGESSGDPLVFNEGTTNSTGRFPANATFGSVEQAQAEGQVFAAGSWQGTPGVLNQGRVAAGITDNANFNNLNTQSKAFWGLILNTNKRPALRDYLLGQSNDINAAHEDLALEFAAITGPSGKGSYDGDSAGNMANTKAADVRKALEQARAELMSNPVNFN